MEGKKKEETWESRMKEEMKHEKEIEEANQRQLEVTEWRIKGG